MSDAHERAVAEAAYFAALENGYDEEDAEQQSDVAVAAYAEEIQ